MLINVSTAVYWFSLCDNTAQVLCDSRWRSRVIINDEEHQQDAAVVMQEQAEQIVSPQANHYQVHAARYNISLQIRQLRHLYYNELTIALGQQPPVDLIDLLIEDNQLASAMKQCRKQ